MNRRRSNRIDVFVPVFLFKDEEFLEQTFVGNTSLEGMYLLSNKNISLRSQLELHFIHTSHEQFHYDCISAKVMHSSKLGYGLSCQEIPLSLLAFIYHHGVKNLHKRPDFQYQLSLAM